MKLHLRFDSFDPRHTRASLFVNGANVGQITLTNAEALWLDHILEKGCEQMSPDDTNPIEYVSSGELPEVVDAALDAAVRAARKS